MLVSLLLLHLVDQSGPNNNWDVVYRSIELKFHSLPTGRIVYRTRRQFQLPNEHDLNERGEETRGEKNDKNQSMK